MSTAAAAILVSTAVSTGLSLYQSEEQRKAAKDAEKKRQAEMEKARLEEERIARETRPDAIHAEGIDYGVDTEDTETMDFLVKRPQISKTAGVNTVGTAGLGYS